MAIGQIFDYKRFASTKTAVSILLPERPRRDLVELIESAGINMIYQAGDAFTRRCPPTRVLSNGFSTVETKAGLRGMIADRAEHVADILSTLRVAEAISEAHLLRK